MENYVEYEQLSFIECEEIPKKKKELLSVDTNISQRVYEAFEIYEVPFFGCQYDVVYPLIHSIIPQETVTFLEFGMEVAISCELICATICHQINWDFLRRAVYKKTQKNLMWVTPNHLQYIGPEDIELLLGDYSKPERIRAIERADLLNKVGIFLFENGGFDQLLQYSNNDEETYQSIRRRLMQCEVFSEDPAEKKLQLFLQKLSMYNEFSFLSNYCEPTIDYHLIRCFLRRGLLFPVGSYGKEYLNEFERSHKESTVAALRKHCITLIKEISLETRLSIGEINQIEWHIARSVCKEDNCDCLLIENDAKWVKKVFSRCPFYKTCMAVNSDELKNYNAPVYTGTSY